MLICCSSDCEKCNQCGKYIDNLSDKYKNQMNTVEPLASFGWGSISIDSSGKTHWETHTTCGFDGHYAMFEPIEGPIISEGLNPNNLHPNTISLGGCEKIVLSPKGLGVEIDLKISDFDKFEFIEINGKRFNRITDELEKQSKDFEKHANEYKKLDIKYNNISEKYRLCKDANDGLKKKVVALQKENERLYEIKLDLENQLIEKGWAEYEGADEIEKRVRTETTKELLLWLEYRGYFDDNGVYGLEGSDLLERIASEFPKDEEWRAYFIEVR